MEHHQSSRMGDLHKMKKPAITASVRMSLELWNQINKFVEDSICKNFSEAARVLIQGGLKLQDFKEVVDEPSKLNQFINEMNSIMKKEQIFDWTKSLNEQQIEAIGMALKMEKESRFQATNP